MSALTTLGASRLDSLARHTLGFSPLGTTASEFLRYGLWALYRAAIEPALRRGMLGLFAGVITGKLEPAIRRAVGDEPSNLFDVMDARPAPAAREIVSADAPPPHPHPHSPGTTWNHVQVP